MEVPLSKATKRARKKAVRDQRIAQAQAAQRRRRFTLLGGILVVLIVLGLALFTGGGDGEAVADECWTDAARGPGERTYSEPPEMTLKEDADYAAVISTSEGDIAMDLLEEDTPETVNNFVCLARDGFYDGLIWHRVEKDLVIQTGSPVGGMQGGPGYSIRDELPESEDVYTFGTVAMANSGPNSGGSQFFVVVKDSDPEGGFESAGYPPAYSVFGEVDTDDEQSTETLLAISNARVRGGVNPVTATKPLQDITIESIEIEES
jgi:cyclophilin family peptidyl-prolyl cis-trans isomerase